MSTVAQQLAKLAEKELNWTGVSVEKRWNPVLSQDEYCIVHANQRFCEKFLGKTYGESRAVIENMSIS